MADTVQDYGDDGLTGEFVRVKHPEPDKMGTGRSTMRIRKDRYDPDVHELADGEEPPKADAAEDEPEPADMLVDLVGTRQANALARAGLATIDAALAYHEDEGDLTELKDVGPGTVEDLLAVR